VFIIGNSSINFDFNMRLNLAILVFNRVNRALAFFRVIIKDYRNQGVRSNQMMPPDPPDPPSGCHD
jgi:hypothetical protein